MNILIILVIVYFALLFVPTYNETTAYIRTIGLLIIGAIILLNVDWVGVINFINNYLDNVYNWLLEKSDGDKKKANGFFWISIIIVTQPIVFGIFSLIKRN